MRLVRSTQAALCIVFAAMFATTSSAQTPGGGQCATRDQVVAALATKYGETRNSIGLAANNTLMEVWASEKTGTWTITVTMPSGVTCMVASGQGYEGLSEVLSVPGEPT